jgi:hypothetical protein
MPKRALRRQPIRHLLSSACACAWAAALVASGPAVAIDDQYFSFSTNAKWENTGTWSPTGLPTAADNVTVRTPFGISTTVAIDAVTGTARASNLTLGTPGLLTVTLRQTGGTLQTTTSNIGSGGAATYLHNAGTHLAGSILIGQNAGDSGSYTFEAGTIQAAGYLSVGGYGSAGTGTFVQNGGAASASAF